LARHALADLFLDTLPCNAHTTASDALWAGLPILTCPGRSFAGRVAGSLLQALELGELAAPSVEEYERLALRFAGNPVLLAGARRKLAVNRARSPLFDTPRFCRHLEAAYLAIWERAAGGRPPLGFTVR
jgi:predicted O-linked N-acetylglucosamine transferase (SPINDLY family)